MFGSKAESMMEYDREKVVKACKSFLDARQRRFNNRLQKLKDEYANCKKYIFFGRKFTDIEIHDIIVGKHWFYGGVPLGAGSIFNSLYEYHSWKTSWGVGEVEQILRCATKANDPVVYLTMTDFDYIEEYYGH